MANVKLSVTASTLSTDAREAPRLARQAGFTGVQMEAYSASLSLPDLARTGRRELLHLLQSENVQLTALRLDWGPRGIGPGADVDRVLAQTDRALEAAAGLGAPLLCIEIGPLPQPPSKRMKRPAITQEQAGLLILPPTLSATPAPESTSLQQIPTAVDPNFVAQVDAALADLGSRADRYNVVVAFRGDLSSFEAIEQALKRASCAWFGVDLDPVAVLRDRWDADEIFSRLGPLIRHVRGRDANLGDERRTRPAIIGAGDTAWDEMLARLDDAGYAGWIGVDPIDLVDRVDAARRGLAHLQRLLNR